MYFLADYLNFPTQEEVLASPKRHEGLPKSFQGSAAVSFTSAVHIPLTLRETISYLSGVVAYIDSGGVRLQ